MKTVAIVQRRMTHYRVPFFERLRAELAARDIRLRVLHGGGTAQELLKDDAGYLDWAEPLPTRYFVNGRLCWQPFARATREADLVVVTQENKLLNNLPPLFGIRRPPRLAFWGHGRNMQAMNRHSLAERFKRATTLRVDWWFAYTEISRSQLLDDGFDDRRITVVNNSIDTTELREHLTEARSLPRAELLREHGLDADAGPVLAYIGSLYPEKRITWVLDAAKRLRSRWPGLQLLVAGAGPEAQLVQQAGSNTDHIRYLGVVGTRAKARMLALADLLMSPGAVGLGVLDSFVAGVPMVTTDFGRHGPEIAYLRPGRNGSVSKDDPTAFFNACEELLADSVQRSRLAHDAASAAAAFSVEAMARKFSQGIAACLTLSGNAT